MLILEIAIGIVCGGVLLFALPFLLIGILALVERSLDAVAQFMSSYGRALIAIAGIIAAVLFLRWFISDWPDSLEVIGILGAVIALYSAVFWLQSRWSISAD